VEEFKSLEQHTHLNMMRLSSTHCIYQLINIIIIPQSKTKTTTNKFKCLAYECNSLSILQCTPVHKFPSISHTTELHHRQSSSREPKQHQLSCNCDDINHTKQHHTFLIWSNLAIDKTTTHSTTRKKVMINHLLSCLIHIPALLSLFH
jgi:hypothetical protein